MALLSRAEKKNEICFSKHAIVPFARNWNSLKRGGLEAEDFSSLSHRASLIAAAAAAASLKLEDFAAASEQKSHDGFREQLDA